MQSFSHAPRHAPTTGAAFELEHKRHARRWFRAASQQLEIRRAITSAERVETAEWLMQQKESNLRSSGQQNVLGARERDWVCRMAAEETVADAWNLRRQGRRASALLAWHSPFRRYAYTISYEKQEADCSPGVLLLFAVVRETMEEGKEFDFLTGEQPFKTLFATHREPLLCCEGTGHE